MDHEPILITAPPMKFFCVELRADFSLMTFYASWQVFSLIPGLLVWMLGIGIPRSEFFPVPMIESVSYPGAAYASALTSIAVGLLAAFRLFSTIHVRGMTPFWRFICILISTGSLCLLGGVNPFAYDTFAVRVIMSVVDLLDWVAIGAVSTLLSFVFAFSLALGLSKPE